MTKISVAPVVRPFATFALTVLVMLALASPAHAANEVQLLVPGVSGSVRGAIPVTSWTWGARAPIDATSGMSAGRVQHNTLDVVAVLDQSGPPLLTKLNTGANIPKVTLSSRKANALGVLVVYLQYELNNARLVGVTHSQGSATAVPSQRLSFAYQSISSKYIVSTTVSVTSLLDWAAAF